MLSKQLLFFLNAKNGVCINMQTTCPTQKKGQLRPLKHLPTWYFEEQKKMSLKILIVLREYVLFRLE